MLLRVDPQDTHVVEEVDADRGRLDAVAVGELDVDRLCRLGLAALSLSGRRDDVGARQDQAVLRDNLVGVQQQYGEKCPLLRSGDVERQLFVEHFQRTQNPKLHCCLAATVAPPWKALKPPLAR